VCGQAYYRLFLVYKNNCNITTQLQIKTKLFLTVKSLILWQVLVRQLMPQGDKNIKDQFTAENGRKGQIWNGPISKKISKDLP